MTTTLDHYLVPTSAGKVYYIPGFITLSEEIHILRKVESFFPIIAPGVL